MGQRPMIFEVEIIVEPDEDGFYACCPSLKGLHVGGDTEEEVIQNAKDAVLAYLGSLIKHGEPIPLKVVSAASCGLPSNGQPHAGQHIESVKVDLVYA